MIGKLIIVRGIPGSGKTTFVENQRAGDNPELSFHFEADMYFEWINLLTGQKEYSFDQSQLGNAHAWCQEQTKRALTKGGKVYVSNTFTTLKELVPYLEMATELGAKIEIHEMSEIPVVEGKRKNIHNVPQDVIDKMLQRWLNELPSPWNTIQYFIH